MIPSHLQSHIDANVRETQRQAILSASFPLPATKREATFHIRTMKEVLASHEALTAKN